MSGPRPTHPDAWIAFREVRSRADRQVTMFLRVIDRKPAQSLQEFTAALASDVRERCRRPEEVLDNSPGSVMGKHCSVGTTLGRVTEIPPVNLSKRRPSRACPLVSSRLGIGSRRFIDGSFVDRWIDCSVSAPLNQSLIERQADGPAFLLEHRFDLGGKLSSEANGE